MKKIAIILSILIFSNAMKAEGALKAIISIVDVSYVSSSCCTSSKGDTCDFPDDTKDDKEKCCDSNSCDCTCCLHLAYCNDFVDINNFGPDYPLIIFGYDRLNGFDHLSSIFHPPLSI